MRRHQMETFPVLLALCAWNSTVTGEFPAQRPVARSFDVFFGLRLNKRLSKQWWGWWFETPSLSLWHHLMCVECCLLFQIGFKRNWMLKYGVCWHNGIGVDIVYLVYPIFKKWISNIILQLGLKFVRFISSISNRSRRASSFTLPIQVLNPWLCRNIKQSNARQTNFSWCKWQKRL